MSIRLTDAQRKAAVAAFCARGFARWADRPEFRLAIAEAVAAAIEAGFAEAAKAAAAGGGAP